MKIIFVGEAIKSSRSPQRLRAISDMGHDVVFIPTTIENQSYEDRPGIITRIRHRLRMPKDIVSAGESLLAACLNGADFVWIDNASMIKSEILMKVSKHIPIIWYSEDDMMNKAHGSVYIDKAMSLFTLWVTTKSFNASKNEMPTRGIRNILFVNNSYDTYTHKITPPSQDELKYFGCDVSFIGTFETFRANSILYLANNGIKVRIWGNGWNKLQGRHSNIIIENRPVYNEDYAKAIYSSKINLCFLRKFNRDLQTCRSIEIPACGGFMLHERNHEITSLLHEDQEAAYFDDDRELLEKCRYWLNNPDVRMSVALAGHQKVISNQMSHHDLVCKVIQTAQRIKDESTC